MFEQLAFDLALVPFSRTETSKRVCDECAKRDSPIGRAAINFVIKRAALRRREPRWRHRRIRWPLYGPITFLACAGARASSSTASTSRGYRRGQAEGWSYGQSETVAAPGAGLDRDARRGLPMASAAVPQGGQGSGFALSSRGPAEAFLGEHCARFR